jgi:RNA polymerase sigma-70 factor, ECF subfamily
VAAVEAQPSARTSWQATGNDPADILHRDTRNFLGWLAMTEQHANTTPGATPVQRRSADRELVARFEREVVPLRESLYRHALRLCRNHFDAEDLTQETMLKAYRGFHSFQPGSNLNAWMFRILSNVHINAYRKTRAQVEQCFSEELTDRQLSAAYSRCTPQDLRSAEDVALDSLPDNDIKTAMQALPAQFRTAVYYADVEGLPRGEIAAMTNSQCRTVLSRLHRGRRRPRNLLDASANHPCGARPIPPAS